jgi:2,3-bisphosphoglycerate-independent phosphoglycerate mutase
MSFQRKSRPSGSGPVALIILDGFGLRADSFGNAVQQSKKPNFDKIWSTYPCTTLEASGEAVGLPDGQFGNSEVGHSNIGAGRVLYQDFTRINKSISTGELFENNALKAAMVSVAHSGKKLHLCGLVSDGGVHSHINHLMALMRMAVGLKVENLVVHAFTDGRDTTPKSGEQYLKQVTDLMADLKTGTIGTVIGRYFAMDRDRRWDRTEKAFRTIVFGEGKHVTDPIAAVRDSYEAGVTDEFIEPIVHVNDDGVPVGTVDEGDAVVFFNFRPDRAIQLSRAFGNKLFADFDRKDAPRVRFITLTKYSETVESSTAFKPITLNNTLGEVLARAGLTQLRIAETEKYPHVTFFFSGGCEEPFPGEDRILIPSPHVATYDLKPEMSAYEVADAAAERMRSGEIDVMILNFANPDMVGHTGDLNAAIKAIEAVDECLGKVLDAIASRNGVALVTADHGNADIMIDPETKEPCTTHTTNPVPLIVTKPGVKLREGGVLADLSPTILDLLGVEQPSEMDGKTLIEK